MAKAKNQINDLEHKETEWTDGNQPGAGRVITEERRGRVVKKHVQRTHGQWQTGDGLRVGGGFVGGSGDGKMETTVIEQQ